MKIPLWAMMAGVIYAIQTYDRWAAGFVLIYFLVANVGWGLAEIAVLISDRTEPKKRSL